MPKQLLVKILRRQFTVACCKNSNLVIEAVWSNLFPYVLDNYDNYSTAKFMNRGKLQVSSALLSYAGYTAHMLQKTRLGLA